MNILVLTYWSYKDALIQSYTLPYIKIFQNYLPKESKVYLVTLEQPHIALNADTLERENSNLADHGIEILPFDYVPFGVKALWKHLGNLFFLWRFISQKKIDVLHGWCTPGGALGYLLSIITGKKLVLDSFEPHAEPMVESGTWKQNSLAYRVLFSLERLQAKRAHTVIGCVEKMRDYALEKYGVSLKNYYHIPACVDLELFDLSHKKDPKLLQELELVGKIVCVYAGKFGGSYLQQESFDFFAEAEQFWGNRFRVLLLNNQSEDSIRKWAENSGLSVDKIVQRFVPHAEVARYMGLGDFGLTPFIPVPSKRYGTPIKTGEYWALGLPVVITPNISDDSEIIKRENIGAILSPLEREGYRKAIQQIDTLLQSSSQEGLANKIRNIAKKFRSFRIAHSTYKKVYG